MLAGDMLDTREAASRIGVSEATLRASRVEGHKLARQVEAGLLPRWRDFTDWEGRCHVRYDEAELEAVLARRSVVPRLARKLAGNGVLVLSGGQFRSKPKA